MGLRTGQQYIDGLRDGREVWYHGERVDDVTTFPEFAASVRIGETSKQALHANIGVSMPTAQLTNVLPYRDDVAANESSRYDLVPSVTYTRAMNRWEVGAHGAYTLRTIKDQQQAQNEWSNRVDVSGWLKTSVSRNTHALFGVSYSTWASDSPRDQSSEDMISGLTREDVLAMQGNELDLTFGVSHSFSGSHHVGLNYEAAIRQDSDKNTQEEEGNYNLIWRYDFR